MVVIISKNEVLYNAKLKKYGKIVVELNSLTPVKGGGFLANITYWADNNGVRTFIETRPPLDITKEMIDGLFTAQKKDILYSESYSAQYFTVMQDILLMYVQNDFIDEDGMLNIYGISPKEWLIYYGN